MDRCGTNPSGLEQTMAGGPIYTLDPLTWFKTCHLQLQTQSPSLIPLLTPFTRHLPTRALTAGVANTVLLWSSAGESTGQQLQSPSPAFLLLPHPAEPSVSLALSASPVQDTTTPADNKLTVHKSISCKNQHAHVQLHSHTQINNTPFLGQFRELQNS